MSFEIVRLAIAGLGLLVMVAAVVGMAIAFLSLRRKRQP